MVGLRVGLHVLVSFGSQSETRGKEDKSDYILHFDFLVGGVFQTHVRRAAVPSALGHPQREPSTSAGVLTLSGTSW